MVGVLIMSLVKFTVHSELFDLVDAIGLEYEREQYDIDVDYLLNQNDYDLCQSLMGNEFTEGLVYTERLY